MAWQRGLWGTPKSGRKETEMEEQSQGLWFWARKHECWEPHYALGERTPFSELCLLQCQVAGLGLGCGLADTSSWNLASGLGVPGESLQTCVGHPCW